MIHDRLKEIYDEFDRFCRSSNIDYSIDADYYNVQAYRLLGPTDVGGTLRHMSNYVKDKWVDLEYDGFRVDYNEMKSKNFNVPTYNPLFKFTLKPLQEEEMNEDSIKGSSNAHGRKQAAFPSSFRKNKTRDTYEDDKKKKDKTKKESFEDRLLSFLNENVGLSMIEPDILLVRNTAEKPEEEEETLEGALKAESKMLQRYLSILESSEDEKIIAIVENLADRCTKQISELENLLENEDGTA